METKIKENLELLSEMEHIQILGGRNESSDSNFLSCDHDTHCHGAHCGNCVAQCGCDDKGEGSENP